MAMLLRFSFFKKGKAIGQDGQASCLICARAVVNWRSRSVAKSAY